MAKTMSEILNPTMTDDAFPDAPPGWTRDDAERSAELEGVTLSEDHWAIIKALQNYFARNTKSNVRALHDALDELLHAKGGIKYLYEIFPGGPVAQGCRFAGLEPPAGAVDKSFGSVQ